MIAQLVELTTGNRDVSGSIPDHYIGGGSRLAASTLAIIYLYTRLKGSLGLVNFMCKIKIEGYGYLEVILSHYEAIPILLNKLKELGEYGILHKWDDARNKQIKNKLVISINPNKS